MTIDIVKQVSDEDRAYMQEITHPCHITRADCDNILNNDEINRFYGTIKTPAHLKELIGYDSDHYILSDGWLYEEVLNKQLDWLERVLAETKTTSP